MTRLNARGLRLLRNLVPRLADRALHGRAPRPGSRPRRTWPPSSATATPSWARTRWSWPCRSRERPPTRWAPPAPRRSAARTCWPSRTWWARPSRARPSGVIYTHAGPEIGVASTKTFTATITACYLLGLALGLGRGFLAPRDGQKRLAELLEIPELMRRDAGRRRARPRARRRAGGIHELPLPRPRRPVPDRARGRAQAQGDLLHPRRGLRRRRDEARPHRAHRRAHARGRARPARRLPTTGWWATSKRCKARGGRVIAVCHAGDDADVGPRRTCAPGSARRPISSRRCSPSSRSSFSPTTSPCFAAATWTSPRNLAKSVTVE